MAKSKTGNLDDQWKRVRIALSLLATFVSESGYKKNRREYNAPKLRKTLMCYADCPRPPDLHELFGMLSTSFDGVLPMLPRPDPCPKLTDAFVRKLFEIERENPCTASVS